MEANMSVDVPIQIIWGLVGYILVTTGGFIWWAATITEQLKNLKELVTKVSNADGLYARKEDVAKELALFERQQETMWEKLDKIKEKVDSNGYSK